MFNHALSTATKPSCTRPDIKGVSHPDIGWDSVRVSDGKEQRTDQAMAIDGNC
jgi:hypothetical protein